MHAKTVWDVLWAGSAICLGALAATSFAQCVKEKVHWHRWFAWLLASLGWMCYGIGSITLPLCDLYPFFLMATLGLLVGTGVFEGVKLSSLFPTLFGRRGPRN